MKMVNVLTLDVMVKSSDTSMATVLSRDSNDFLFIVVLVNVGLISKCAGWFCRELFVSANLIKKNHSGKSFGNTDNNKP